MAAPAAPTITTIVHLGDGLLEIVVDEQAGTDHYNLYLAGQAGVGIGACPWVEKGIGLISKAGGRGGPPRWKIRGDALHNAVLWAKMTGLDPANAESAASNEVTVFIRDQPNKIDN